MKTSTFVRSRLIMSSPLQLAFVLLLFGLFTITGCKKVETGLPGKDPVAVNKDEGPHMPNTLDLQLVANEFVSPLTLAEAPDHSKRLFVLDQIGKVWIIDASGKKLPQPFIDISRRMTELMPSYDERGLLGMAFHPEFKSNRKFYLFYTAPPPPGGPTVQTGNTGLPMAWNNTTRVSEFKASSWNANMADMGSERIIFQEPHPQFNHNGGTIAFGADGYLYISIGDGGNKNDIGPGHVADWYETNAGGNGQDIRANLKGNILRIDVNRTSGGKNYSIPPDNPFVGKTGLDEIYAYGFRNPYRFSFDMSGSRRLFAGDAGQKLYEEISVVTKGGNYGWNVKEGTHCFNAANELTEFESCPDVDAYGNKLVDPVIELKNFAHPRGGGITVAVVGGNVYRGNSIPWLYGKYIFGSLSADFAPTGKLFVSKPAGNGLWGFTQLPLKSFPSNLGHYLKGFGQDLHGEIYVLATIELGPVGKTGKVFKLVAE